MNSPAERGASPVRLVLPALAAVALVFAAWRVFTLGLANLQVDDSPSEAMRWRPRFPEAVLFAEDRRLRNTKAPPAADAPLVEALGAAPLRPLGYRLMARHSELRGDLARAGALYSIAANRGPRDLPSVAWVARQHLERGEYRAALAGYDQMLRVEPELSNDFANTMIGIAATPAAQKEMAALLARNPPWRGEFIERLLSRYPDSAALYPLIEQMHGSVHGLTTREMGLWINRLAANGQWGPAYLTWVQSLSPEASQRIGNVYNGSFELDPSQIGFDWQFRNVPGARISRAETPGAGEHYALRVEFEDRRVPFANVRQMLALAPGSYRLKGRVKLDDLRSERGLVWTLRCVESGEVIGETGAMSGRREWKGFEAAFTVPEQRCGGQLLVLRIPSRIRAEQLIGGVAWFDDLSIKSN
jgi:tetratricopeptide (TPR) repeat protein